MVSALTAVAGCSFRRIVNIFKHMGNMGYNMYCTLYHSYVLPVANYALAVQGFMDPRCFKIGYRGSTWGFTGLPFCLHFTLKWTG